MRESKEHRFTVIGNWLRSVSVESLLELKEKCLYWRKQTGNREIYPYECVVWQFNKGPDGQDWGEETIANKLGITLKKVHESKWIGLDMLGWKATHSPAYSSRARVTAEIERCWALKRKTQKANQKAQLKKEFGDRPIIGVENLAKVSLGEEIIQGIRKRRPFIEREIADTQSIIDSSEKELEGGKKELMAWKEELAVYQRIEEIEAEEQELMKRLRKLQDG